MSSNPSRQRVEMTFVKVLIIMGIVLAIAAVLRVSDRPLGLLIAELIGGGIAVLAVGYWSHLSLRLWMTALVSFLLAAATVPFVSAGKIDTLGGELMLSAVIIGILFELRKHRRASKGDLGDTNRVS